MNEMNNNKTQEQENRFDYMDQKPQHNRKALAALGISLSAVVLLVICLSIYGVSYAKEHADEIAQSPYGWIVAGFAPDLMETEENTEKIFAGTDMPEPGEISEANQMLNMLTTSDDRITDEPSLPEYTEEPICLTLHQTPVRDDVRMTPSMGEDYAGCYLLKPDTVYAICWDASPLYANDEEKVSADIVISSDFIIEEGGTGAITVRVDDLCAHVVYTGTLRVASDSHNLGIEFCSDECKRYAYGAWPEIKDGKFTMCFYTSGEYAEDKRSTLSSADGSYYYCYGVDGSAEENSLVFDHHDIPKPASSPQKESMLDDESHQDIDQPEEPSVWPTPENCLDPVPPEPAPESTLAGPAL